jgi:hypothetical protein
MLFEYFRKIIVTTKLNNPIRESPFTKEYRQGYNKHWINNLDKI